MSQRKWSYISLTISCLSLLFMGGCTAVSESSPILEPTTQTSTTSSDTLESSPEEPIVSDSLPDKAIDSPSSPDTEKKKTVALTFDDGPNPVNTKRLLEILKEENVPATFFVVGENVSRYPELVKQAVNEGHEVGNHTYNHPDLTTLSSEQISEQIRKTDELVQGITNQKPKYLRPPYGSINSTVASIANRPSIQWSVDSEDWKSRDSSKIVQRIKETVYDGSIILMHDIHKETVDAIPEVIRVLKEEGYSFDTVSSLLDNPSSTDIFYGKSDSKPAVKNE